MSSVECCSQLRRTSVLSHCRSSVFSVSSVVRIDVEATGLSRPPGVLCQNGLRPGVALARKQSNQGSHPVARIGATGFELEAPPHNQAVTPRDSQGDSQSANPIPDHDLQRVINAWCNLPANLKAAIMAIVGPDSLSHR